MIAFVTPFRCHRILRYKLMGKSCLDHRGEFFNSRWMFLVSPVVLLHHRFKTKSNTWGLWRGLSVKGLNKQKDSKHTKKASKQNQKRLETKPLKSDSKQNFILNKTSKQINRF